MIKNILKNLLPPILLKILKKKPKYGFFGNYRSWQEALDDSGGYDSSQILAKVENSLLKVKRGEAVYERDSVLFDKAQYSWPVLSALLWAASQRGNRLNLVDFGGSLGSSYFQNRNFLKHLQKVRWNIVEQKNFVGCGKISFESHDLKFYQSLEECFKETQPNTLLVSGTLQYLKEPYEALREILLRGFEFMIFDRTTFLKNRDRLTVQKVRPGIYEASYPAWFLNEEKFLKECGEKYDLWAEFDSLAGQIPLAGDETYEKGYIFKKR
jgi:putative methyltransferase (TIGR04325 family)